MRSRKRLLSLLLALIMVFSLLPTMALAEDPAEEPAPAEEPVEDGSDTPEEPVGDGDLDIPADEPEAEPAPADEPESGSVTVKLSAWTCDADGHYLSEGTTGGTAKLRVNGGTPKTSPVTANHGDVITIVPSPASGYEVHDAGYSNGLTPLGWLSDSLQLTLPADQTWIEMDVTFAPVGTVLHVGDGSFGVRWPAAGGSYSGPVPAETIASASRPFSVYSAYWYGGADSGCQGQSPASFQPGRHYYAEIELAPLDKFCFTETSSFFANFYTQDSSDFESDLNGTCLYDSATGRLRVTTGEMQYPGDVRLRVFPYSCQSDGTLLDQKGGTVKLSVNGAAPVEADELMVCAGDTISISAEPDSGFALQTAQWGDGDDLLGIVTDTLKFTIPAEGKYFELVVYFVRKGEPATLKVCETVLDDTGGYLDGVDGGTVKLSVNGASPVEAGELQAYVGDTVRVYPEAFSGYQVQQVMWGNGAAFFGVITETLEFTISEGMTFCEIDVFYSSAGTKIPIDSASFELPLPVPGSSAGVSQAIPRGFEQFEVLCTVWYGGTGSGCQGEITTSFIEGASYYAIVVLIPKEHWRFTDATTANVMLDNGVWADNLTLTNFPDEGTFAVQTPEYRVYTKDILETSLDLELYELGGSYTGAVPAAVTAPEGAHYTVTSAYWFNYDYQESGGMGLAPSTFTREGRYFVEINLVPDEGYTFQWTTKVNLSNGKVGKIYKNSDGSLMVSSSWFSMDEENAAQLRRVFVQNYVMSAAGSLEGSAEGGYAVPSNNPTRVGDTLTLNPVVKNGYRLQWLTVSDSSEAIGVDITETKSYTVREDEGDLYVMACFSADDEPIKLYSITLDAVLPAPGTYTGYVPGDVTTHYSDSKFTVADASWLRYDNGTAQFTQSIELGESYVLRFTVLPTENWIFHYDMNVGIDFSDGSFQHSSDGDLTVVYNPDGTLTVTTAPVTIAEQPIDAVELSVLIPSPGDSYSGLTTNGGATVYTPKVGLMYTLWRNAEDQATGTAGDEPTGFELGCVYHVTVRIHADQGYYLTPDTQVTLLNDVPYKATYSAPDRSIFINIDNYSLPGVYYRLSGSYVKFLVNDKETTLARPGDNVTVRTDITTQPMGTYLADVSSEDVELTQLDPIRWSFAMPAKDVNVTGHLLPQETFVVDLTDGSVVVDAKYATWIFGSYPSTYSTYWDVTGDGEDDIWIRYHDDGSAEVIRVGSVYGDYSYDVASGCIGTLIFRFGPETYSLWLGGVQVTAANKNKIPVAGGTAKYDPATRTLTLTDVTGVNGLLGHGSSMVGSYFIVSTYDLTVKGSADLQSDYRGGILCGGNLTLQGDFRFESEYGFEIQGNLDVIGGELYVEAYDGVAVDVPYGSVMLTDCYTYFTSESDDALYCKGLTVSGSSYANFQGAERGIVCSGTVNFYDGYLWAWSNNDIGIQASAFNMEGGFLTANGNIQAIEADSISIPSGHTIEKPANGYIGSDGGKKTVIDPSTNGPAQRVWINGQYCQVTIAVKDTEGNEGVGGKIAFDDESFTATGHSKMLETYETTMIRAQADTGYRFDHWEGPEGFWKTDSEWEFSSSNSTHLQYWAVFEALIAVNAANFPDAAFRGYVSDKIDLDGDGWLTMAERNAVESIDVSGLGVGSLVGIKYFPELYRLYCYNNPDLREVDVRKNPKIKYLQCYSCSGLKYLYVTGCAELTDLRCYGCSLTGINFYGCTSLAMLQCYSNNLSSLELAQCPNLARLDCFNNTNLSSLSINSDKLYILYCYKTKLDTLDISACSLLQQTLANGTFSQTSSYDSYNWKEGSTLKGDLRCNTNADLAYDLGIAINAVNFPDPLFRADIAKYYDPNFNGWLSPMEISQTTSIGFEDEEFSSMQGIGFFTEISSLLTDNAPTLTSVDLRGNTKLKYVDVCGNSLREIKLDGLTELISLGVDSNKLTALDVTAFALEYLWVNNNPMTSLELGQQPNLKKLYAYWIDLDELDISGCPLLLDAYLNGEQTLHENAEHGNYVEYAGPEGGFLFIDADQVVATEPNMGIPINSENFPDPIFRQYVSRRFDLNGNGWLKPNEIEAAAAVELEEYGDLSCLDGICFLTEVTYILIDGAPKLTELDVSENSKLTGLEIWGNGLTTLTLGQHPALGSFYADNNALTAVDLSGAPNLTDLDLSYNPLTEIDLSAAPNLRWVSIHDTDLGKLDLTGNELLLDAYLNGTKTTDPEEGYVKYVGPKGGTLIIDADQAVKAYLSGDINGDGVVNNKDVMRLLRYVKNNSVSVVEDALDVNGDGVVNNKDVLRLLRYVKNNDVVIY